MSSASILAQENNTQENNNQSVALPRPEALSTGGGRVKGRGGGSHYDPGFGKGNDNACGGDPALVCQWWFWFLIVLLGVFACYIFYYFICPIINQDNSITSG